MKNIKNYIYMKDDHSKKILESYKNTICAFNDYDDVTKEMVNKFWAQKEYAEKLIDKKDIRKEFQGAYNISKKNVAMLDFVMSPYYTVYFDKDANLLVLFNKSEYYSSHKILCNYADKFKEYFKLDYAISAKVNLNMYECLFNKEKK